MPVHITVTRWPERSAQRISRRSALCALASTWVTGALGCRPGSTDRPEVTADKPTIASVPAVPASNRGWPALFGPDGTSWSEETGLCWDWSAAGPPEKWRAAIGRGYSSPVVLGDDLIVLHRVENSERVSCFSAETGQLRWEQAWPTTYTCKYEYSNGPYGTPRIDGDAVYAAGAQGQLVCLSRSDGAVRWKRLLRADVGVTDGLFGFGPGLLTDDERLYLNAGAAQRKAGVMALDKQTGETVWTATDHAMAYTQPRLVGPAGSRRLLALTETGLVSLDPQTGREHWTVPFHSKCIDTINAVTPVVQDDLTILIAGPGPGAICLRLLLEGPPATVWKDRRVLDSQFNSVVHQGGHFYGFSSMRQGGASFRCVNVATGKLRWEYASDVDRGQALAVDGRIILWGERGDLAVVDLSPQRLVTRHFSSAPLLEKPCYSAPALSRGLLYLRNETTLLCLDLRRKSPPAR